MDLTFVYEGRFERCKNGKVYSQDKTFLTHLCARYLCHFENMYILARVLHSDKESLPDEFLAENESVKFIDVPYYIGPLQYIKKRKEIDRVISKYALPERAYICRIPGKIGNIMIKHLIRNNLNYGIEVVGDPWDAFAPGGVKHILSPFFRINGYLSLKKNVYNSSATLYVTENTLQKRYPIGKNRFAIGVSDVILPDDNIAVKPKEFINSNQCVKLISVGSLAQMYKSPDIVIKAVSILKRRGFNCHCVWLGDGVYKDKMIRFAQDQGVVDCFTFKGNVQPDEVRKNLLDSDIFLLVSKTEGLPRAVVEAMAAGLPCIGSKVGGIPELLDEVALVKAGDEVALADKILEFIQNEQLINSQAKRNLAEASKYRESVLNEKRAMFYREVIKISK